MANDNETVASIVKRVRRECNSYPLPNAAGEKLKLVREIEEAHNREIASLKKSVERWMQYHETAKGERDACLDELKKKDAKIAQLRECLREAVEWSCGNPDENCEDCVAHGGDTPCKCEKWRKALEGGVK